MMKKYFFMAVVAIVALCNCSEDEIDVDSIVAWENELMLGKSANGVNSIVIETGVNVKSYTTDGTHKPLNAAGTLWEVLDNKVLRIQTSGNKIMGRDSFLHNHHINYGLFTEYAEVETISGLENLDMSKVTDMTDMFSNCYELKSIDLSSFDTRLVKNMRSMFSNCYKLQSITGLDKFDTSNVTDMSHMFGACKALTELDLSSFDTSNVGDMSFMFSICNALTRVDLSSFNTGKVTDMTGLFLECFSLESLTFGAKFSMANVNEKEWMFNKCGQNGHCYVRGITDPALMDALREDTQWDETHMEFQ